jgi:hypothetical protein
MKFPAPSQATVTEAEHLQSTTAAKYNTAHDHVAENTTPHTAMPQKMRSAR